MKKIALISALLTLTAVYMAPSVGYSFGGQVITHENTPLVMIRFNQRTVYFEKQLYGAVQRAFDIKPNAALHVVQYVPTGKNGAPSKGTLNKAQGNLNSVMQALSSMGIPSNRVSTITELDNRLQYDEVHIYVR